MSPKVSALLCAFIPLQTLFSAANGCPHQAVMPEKAVWQAESALPSSSLLPAVALCQWGHVALFVEKLTLVTC